MNLFLVHHRSAHHAQNSGYGRLADYLDAQIIIGDTTFSYGIAKFLGKLHSQKSGIYNSSSILKSIQLYKLLSKHKVEKNIVHFLNGERDIRHLGFFKRKFPNTKFVATFHKPPEILKKTITGVSALRQLDAAIAVGGNQVAFLKEWLRLEQVVYIPHGVDTQFFFPDHSAKKKNTLLFVGQHLRDFKTLNETVQKLAAAIEELHINVVIHPSYTEKIITHSCVNLLTNVNDVELRTLYQQATALYLPMLDSTACNSILEAMACGLPIITSNVGGNAIYLENTLNILVERNNSEMFVDQTIKLLYNIENLKEIEKISREKSLEFDWNNVADSVINFYKSI